MQLNILMPEKEDGYLHACARIRNISMTRLVERLMCTIAREQLVLAVLDDDSRPQSPKELGERRDSKYHPPLMKKEKPS